MRNVKIEGIVIKRKNFGEADKILTVFTRDSGKMQIKAKGVRRITSRRSPHIELLNHASLALYKAEKFPILTEAQVIHDFSSLKKNLTRVWAAYHVCELIDGFCPENERHEDIFHLLKDTLYRISYEKQIKPAVQEFEIALLKTLGYWNEKQAEKTQSTHEYIEELLERRLKSKYIFSKLT
jgi:DNA repair protein RecO (recombination protein O)